MHPTPRRLRFPAPILCALASTALPAQTCFHFGSHPMPAQLEPAPFPLGCAAAPSWPSWVLWTPAHREPGPHTGYAPGNAIELPRWLVHWRCTGWLLVPVVPDQVRAMGYVIDQPEQRCLPPAP